MKVNINKKEYRSLVDILCLADRIMKIPQLDEFYLGHQTLRKKLLSYYKEMNAEDIIEYSDDFKDYFELHDYEEYLCTTFIMPYNNELFWEQLIKRLSTRDLLNEIGIKNYATMENIDRIRKLGELNEYYAKEFEKHSLSHVYVKDAP